MGNKNVFKLSLTGIAIILLLNLPNVFNSTTANSEGISIGLNTELMKENYHLKQQYAILDDKLNKMEKQLNEIKKYNNIIYSQFLGVDFDTTNYNRYMNISNNDSLYKSYQYDSIFKNVDKRSLYVAKRLAFQLEKLEKTSTKIKYNKNIFQNYPNISPIRTYDFIEITSVYGWRLDPIIKEIRFHSGIDISAEEGSPIYATAKGKISKIKYSMFGYGNRVEISHSYGFTTLYAHMNTIIVKTGQYVQKGEIIGYVGSTGKSTGNHLHYEIRKNDELRDPLGYFYTYLTKDILTSDYY